MLTLINAIVLNFFRKTVDFLPDFFGGLIIFLIGIVLGSILKRVLLTLFSFFKLSSVLEKMNLMEKSQVQMWEEVFAEVLRWTVVIFFFIPTLEVWHLNRVTALLNQFILYLPNIIVAFIIGFVGIIISNLASRLVKNKIVSPIARGVVLFFTILVIMNQLGVAQDLVRILFTGIVAMLAIAGGLAFGLGGKELAHDLLVEARKKLK